MNKVFKLNEFIAACRHFNKVPVFPPLFLSKTESLNILCIFFIYISKEYFVIVKKREPIENLYTQCQCYYYDEFRFFLFMHRKECIFHVIARTKICYSFFSLTEIIFTTKTTASKSKESLKIKLLNEQIVSVWRSRTSWCNTNKIKTAWFFDAVMWVR